MHPNQRHITALDALNTARDEYRTASEDLAPIVSEVGAAQQAFDKYRSLADDAARACESASVGDAVKLEHARRDAEAIAAAAQRRLDAARASREAKQMGVDAAHEKLRRAARAVLESDIRTKFEEFRSLLQELHRVRNSVLGAYVMCDSIQMSPDAVLPDRTWHELDCRRLLTSEVLQIGLPIIGFSMNSPTEMEERNPDGRKLRALVDEQAAQWVAYLDRLERGENFEAAVEDAA